MFAPDKIDLECPCTSLSIAVVQLLQNSLAKVDIDLRMTLYNEIVLSGGNTLLEGFPDRFVK